MGEKGEEEGGRVREGETDGGRIHTCTWKRSGEEDTTYFILSTRSAPVIFLKKIRKGDEKRMC